MGENRKGEDGGGKREKDERKEGERKGWGVRAGEERKGADKERLEVTGLVENGPPCAHSLILRKSLT